MPSRANCKAQENNDEKERKRSFLFVEKPTVFRQFTGYACSSKLETAQNRNVWAARAQPVLPTNYIIELFLMYSR